MSTSTPAQAQSRKRANASAANSHRAVKKHRANLIMPSNEVVVSPSADERGDNRGDNRVDNCVHLNERIRVDALRFATHHTNPLKLDANTQARLLTLTCKLNVDANGHVCVPIEYACSEKGTTRLGRLYAQSYSLQNMSKRLRGFLAHGVYRDVDMVNAHPTLVTQLAKKRGWPHCYLEAYVAKRDAFLRDLCDRCDDGKLTRNDAKTIVLMLLNGAKPGTIAAEFDLPLPLPASLLALRDESNRVMQAFVAQLSPDDEMYANLRKRHAKSGQTTDVNRTMFSYFVGTEENRVLQSIRGYWEGDGYAVGALIFDGLLVDSACALPVEKLRTCEQYVREQTGYAIQLTDTELTTDDVVMPLPKWVYSDYRLLSSAVHSLAMVDEYIRSSVVYIDSGGNSMCMTRNTKNGDEHWVQLQRPIQEVYKKEVMPFRVADGTHGKGVHDVVVDIDDKKHTYCYVYLNERVHYLHQSEKMNVCDWVGFYPYLRPQNIDAKVFNLFTGFKYLAPPRQPYVQWSSEMVAAHPNKAVQHVYSVLADGHAENALYILKYIADMVQRPDQVPGVCMLFMSSMQGTGKNLFWEWIGDVIGKRYYLLSDSLEVLTKQFNQNQQNVLLHVLDEIANYGGSFKSNDQLKTAITRTEICVEPKHKEAFTVKHYARYIMLTNNPWPVRVDNGDRRYAIFRASNHRAGDHVYFTELVAWMKSDDNQREFFHLMANMDLTGFHPRQGIVSTPLKLEMQFNNNKALPMRHIMSMLVDEDDNEEIIIDADTLYGKYRCWLTDSGDGHVVPLREWQAILRDAWDTHTMRQRIPGSDRRQGRLFVLTKQGVRATLRKLTKCPTFTFADVDIHTSSGTDDEKDDDGGDGGD